MLKKEVSFLVDKRLGGQVECLSFPAITDDGMNLIDTVLLRNGDVDYERVTANEIAPRVQVVGGLWIFHEARPRQASHGQIARGGDDVGEGGWRDAHGWVHCRRVREERRDERVDWNCFANGNKSIEEKECVTRSPPSSALCQGGGGK